MTHLRTVIFALIFCLAQDHVQSQAPAGMHATNDQAARLASHGHYAAAIATYRSVLSSCNGTPARVVIPECSQAYLEAARVLVKTAMRHFRRAQTSADKTTSATELASARDDIGRVLNYADRLMVLTSDKTYPVYADAGELKGDALYVLAELMITVDPAQSRKISRDARDMFEMCVATSSPCFPTTPEILGDIRRFDLERMVNARPEFASDDDLDFRLVGTARQSFDGGVAAAQRNDFRTASKHFRDAWTYSRNPIILYNMGLADAKIPGREVRAAALLLSYLHLSPHPINVAELAETIDVLIVQARTSLDTLIEWGERIAPLIDPASARDEYLDHLNHLKTSELSKTDLRCGEHVSLDEYLGNGPAEGNWLGTEGAFEAPFILDMPGELQKVSDPSAHDELWKALYWSPNYTNSFIGALLDDLQKVQFFREQMEFTLGRQGMLSLTVFDDPVGARDYFERATYACPPLRPKFGELFKRLAEKQLSTNPLYASDLFGIAIHFEDKDKERSQDFLGRANAEIAIGYYGDAADDLNHIPADAFSSGSAEDKERLAEVDDIRAHLSLFEGNYSGAASSFDKAMKAGAQVSIERAMAQYLQGDYASVAHDKGGSAGWRSSSLAYLASYRSDMPIDQARQLLKSGSHSSGGEAPADGTSGGKEILELFGSAKPSAELLENTTDMAQSNFGEAGCTYFFYLGEYALARKQMALAKQFFSLQTRRAPEDCAEYIEYVAANAEAKRLQ